MVGRRRRFGTDSDGQAERCRGAPMRSAPVVWVGWEAVDQNQPACGGAREGGNREGAARASLVSRWVTGVVQRCTGYGPKDGIFLITAGSSMQAMIRSAPPQAGQVSMSMPKTRFSRCAQVIAARRCAGVSSCPSAEALVLAPFPRFAGVTAARCLLFGVSDSRFCDTAGQLM